jgi:hypothetical protein
MRPGAALAAVTAGHVAALVTVAAVGVSAQAAHDRAAPHVASDAATYLDATAARLHAAAVAHRPHADDEGLQYTANVKQRVGVSLRTPLKDRTLYRMESAHRVFWVRDGDQVVQILALREQTPVGVDDDDDEVDSGFFDGAFDPMNDRLLFGLAGDEDDVGDPAEDDFWFEHPLYPEYRDAYRFASADTLTLSLPDGRRVQAVELQVVPKRADVHRMTGSLWIEPESGALVRAVYRLSDTFDAMRDIADLRAEDDAGSFRYVPGFFKPWTAEIRMIAVDYSLWDFGVWLPRSFRAEGVVAAGIVKAPASFDVSYEMESVTTRSQLASPEPDPALEVVHFRTRSEAFAYLNSLAFDGTVAYRVDPGPRRRNGERTRFLVPEDLSFLLRSPELPPPIWQDAPGFASQADLEGYFDGLARLPLAPLLRVPATFRWGAQRPDLLRYNRVEALSVGARGQIRPNTPVGPLSITATARIGLADLHPNGNLEIAHETLDRRLAVEGYHELTTIDERARHLGIGNSLLAATSGRDDGDYYRRTGASLAWTPPIAGRRSYRIRAWSEHHEPVDVETSFALFHAFSDTWAFRPNLAADRGWEHGGSVELTPWWGTDPNLAQGGLDLTLQGATGDFEYARAVLVGRAIVPLPTRLRLGVEVGGGTSWGQPSTQRLWYVGGPTTLRGYAPRSLGGTSFGRARVELGRGQSFGRIALFTDLAWAGDRNDIRLDDGLYSVGLGLSILDGLFRLDGAWGLRSPRDFRLDVYLDQIL